MNLFLEKVESLLCHATSEAELFAKSAVTFIQTHEDEVKPILQAISDKLFSTGAEVAAETIIAEALESLTIPVTMATYLSDAGTIAVKAELTKVLNLLKTPAPVPVTEANPA